MRASVADVNEEQLRAFYRSLNDAKTLVGSDLQRNVYRNYTEFVVISKEISNLDGDMLLLRDFLNELRVINTSFKDEVDPMAGIINGKKSLQVFFFLYFLYGLLRETIAIVDPAPIAESITQRRKPSEMATADMQTIYRAQLASLWESIEGSQVNSSTSAIF